jgi:signal transduction histidine kinase
MASANRGDEDPSAEWTLVLARDGTVLAAAGGAPASWIGVRLADTQDVPEAVKAAGRALIQPTARSSTATVPLGPQKRLHITAVDALPVRRAFTDLGNLLRSALEPLERQAESLDVALTIDIQHELEPVAVDAEKLAWAVTALVGNALRYVRHGSHTMPGGTITVRAGFSEAAGAVTIEVQDDGPGIPPERLRDLSGEDRARARVGLGLSMVREVVEAHGGTLAIVSDTDVLQPGTTIRLMLPVVSAPASARASDSI